MGLFKIVLSIALLNIYTESCIQKNDCSASPDTNFVDEKLADRHREKFVSLLFESNYLIRYVVKANNQDSMLKPFSDQLYKNFQLLLTAQNSIRRQVIEHPHLLHKNLSAITQSSQETLTIWKTFLNEGKIKKIHYDQLELMHESFKELLIEVQENTSESFQFRAAL